MMSGHLTDERIQRFISRELAPELTRGTLTHILVCSDCAERLRPRLSTGAGPLPEPLDQAYESAIDRAWAGTFEVLRRGEARAAHPRPARRPAYTEVAQVSDLLEQSFAARYRNPREMVVLAQRAVAAAEQLDPGTYGPAARADWRARAGLELANAYRVAEMFDEAGAAYGEAEALCHQGTLDALLLARLLDVRASLLSDRRQLGAALETLRQLYHLYRELGETHQAGRALISRGIYTQLDGNPRGAVKLLTEGIALVDLERDPELAATARQSLLHALVDCGQAAEAAELLRQSGLREAFAGSPMNLAKLLCLEGKIHKGLEHLDRAEKAFQEARARFAHDRQFYLWGLAGLELAAVWLRQGRLDAVRQVAEETYTAFCELEVHREAKAAIQYLVEACRREAATVRLIERLGGFFEQLERNPQLRFSRDELG
jgi:tetratricopeptide (TPR) repeat protein